METPKQKSERERERANDSSKFVSSFVVVLCVVVLFPFAREFERRLTLHTVEAIAMAMVVVALVGR